MEYERVRNEFIWGRRVAAKTESTAVHCHEAHELYYMRKGSTSYFIKDEIYKIEKGNFVFIPRDIMHMTDNRECMNNERILLYIPDKVFDGRMHGLLEQLTALRVIEIPDSHQPMLEGLLLKLEEEFRRDEMENDLLLELYVLELLALLCRYQRSLKRDHKEADGIVYEISEYISSHYDQDISLDVLGKIFGISPAHLSRRFKEVSGMGLNQYLTYVRISNAEKALRNSKMPITEVAKQCGFNGSNYFSAVFKKTNGITPLSYRRMKGGDSSIESKSAEPES